MGDPLVESRAEQEGAMLTQAPVVVGPRGRLTLPVQVRAAAGFDEGDEVVAVTEAPGRVVLVTRAAIRAELDAALPSDDPEALEATEALRAYREEDVTAADAHLDRAAPGAAKKAGKSHDDPGRALLRTLGLAS
ncbi:MAG TPA: AbrB/MazE/SpoVT family DNA-binding domain-containing protein [Pseudonocardiaceae bacterium]|nr:AbrB/MazE/SpoVT family DNA-binding domain-containing protein [Pseudonocardiaceae bacterium]